MAAEINLINSDKKALVDEDDKDYINQWEWSFDEETGYAYRLQDGEKVFMQYQVINRFNTNVN